MLQSQQHFPDPACRLQLVKVIHALHALEEFTASTPLEEQDLEAVLREAAHHTHDVLMRDPAEQRRLHGRKRASVSAEGTTSRELATERQGGRARELATERQEVHLLPNPSPVVIGQRGRVDQLGNHVSYARLRPHGDYGRECARA